jgi:hypothetical protein
MDDGVLTIRLPRVRSTTSRLSVMFSSAGKALAPRSLLSRTSLPPAVKSRLRFEVVAQ